MSQLWRPDGKSRVWEGCCLLGDLPGGFSCPLSARRSTSIPWLVFLSLLVGPLVPPLSEILPLDTPCHLTIPSLYLLYKDGILGNMMLRRHFKPTHLACQMCSHGLDGSSTPFPAALTHKPPGHLPSTKHTSAPGPLHPLSVLHRPHLDSPCLLPVLCGLFS